MVRILGRMNIGGPAIHVALLTSGLNDERFCSILVTGTRGQSEGDMLYVARQYGVAPHIIPQLGRDSSWREDLVAFWKLCRLFARERPDIVHTHTAKAGALGRLAAVLTKVPVRIHTFHGHIFHGYFGPFKTKLFILIERGLALLTTKIVAISQAQFADLCGRYRIAAREKFTVIPLGLDLAPYLSQRAEHRSQDWRWNGRAMVIGLIGRLVPVKNPHMAVQVFERLLRKNSIESPIHLVICGDGELRLDLKEHVRRAGLDEQVLFTGWERDMADLYARLDLIILTSLNEGTPVALLEGMAAGLPFVATRVGGVSDMVIGPGHVVRDPDGTASFTVYLNGILVETGDVVAFAAAMEYLLADPERRFQMGQAGRSFVRERFSKDRLLKDISQLYLECLEGAPGLVAEPFGGPAN